MLDAITRLVQPVIQIKRDEWRKAIPMFLYFSFTIATLYILKPIRSSTFLTSHGAANLRYAYIGEGAFLIFFTFAYIYLSGWFRRKRTFFSAATVFFISNVLAFWFLFHFRMAGWVSYLFYIWVAAYSITIVTQFWTLANDLFDPRQAKRLFGFILSGGSLGGVVGGLVTNRTAERFGTENLLLLVAAMLFACLFLIYFVARESLSGIPAKPVAKSDEVTRLRDKSTWKLFFGSRYLLLIVALVMFGKMVSTLVDNQFNAVVENVVTEKNARTAFFGGFLAWLNVASFVLQLIVASHVLRGIGVAMSLLLLPIGLAMGSVATLLFPTLAAAIAMKTYDGSMNYSISQLGKEILYIPIPSAVRYRVKPIIDMLGFRASKSVAGLFIIFVTTLLGIPDEKLGLVVLLVIPLWIVIVWSVRDGYKHAIKKLISSEEHVHVAVPLPHEFRDVVSSLNGSHLSEKMRPFLTHPSSVVRKIAATGCLIDRGNGGGEQAREIVKRMTDYEALGLKRADLESLLREHRFPQIGVFGSSYFSEKLQALRERKIDLKTLLSSDEARVLAKLSECVENPSEDIHHKRIAILMLSVLGTQGAVDILLSHLMLAEDRSLRFNMIRALNQIRSREHRQFAYWMVKREILNEAKDYLSLHSVLREYRGKGGSGTSSETPYLQVILEALKAENLERIFRLLSLLYSGDIILVIYKQLSDAKATESFKAHALELLENVVEPRLARVIAPILEEADSSPGEDLESLLSGFFERKDPWFLICAVLSARGLKLERFYRGVDDLSRSSVPLVRETAAIVLDQMKQ